MSSKQYAQITTAIFTLIAILQALRLYNGWEAVIAGWSVSIWFSWVALVVAGFLAISGFKLARK